MGLLSAKKEDGWGLGALGHKQGRSDGCSPTVGVWGWVGLPRPVERGRHLCSQKRGRGSPLLGVLRILRPRIPLAFAPNLARQASVGLEEDGWGARIVLWDTYLPAASLQAEPHPMFHPLGCGSQLGQL